MSHVLLSYAWSHFGQQETRIFVGELLPKAFVFPTAALVVLQPPGHLGAVGMLLAGAGAVLHLPSLGQPSVPAKICGSALKVPAPAQKTITQSRRTGYNLSDDNEIMYLLSDSFIFMRSCWKNASMLQGGGRGDSGLGERRPAEGRNHHGGAPPRDPGPDGDLPKSPPDRNSHLAISTTFSTSQTSPYDGRLTGVINISFWLQHLPMSR